ncbi:MAG: GNAT family N-acetyltransferase, partial [Bacteroidales bacterium]|nr:GNAT family N-acetyltransferase [Bacteroidales bacterium]
MMEPFERIDIQELPLRVPSVRRQVEDFLVSNGLRLEDVDLYRAVLGRDGRILAGGGLRRDVIKCVAVSEAARSAGLSAPLISRLISEAAQRGYTNVKVYTKPENRAVFESLGFRLLAAAPKAILMENGRGLEEYCRYLRSHPADAVIVMNANPFTLGHQYLLEQAAAILSGDIQSTVPLSIRRAESRRMVVIPVKEDRSRFPYIARKEMIREGGEGMVDVVEGSDYQISSTTFPTYFLKSLSDAAETQMWLDIDLFGRHIAPALGAKVRFVGSEPNDQLTARYNAMMKYLLPE